jgi:tetratricopeptide (TPR) repeat protein
MPAYKFSPNLASPEERRKTFVAREAILDDLLDRVRKIESGARHCILIGPRGIGKTHLLLLLADNIEADETLASRWVVVRFAEEEYSITSLAELLLRIVESLPNEMSENIERDVELALAHILDFCTNSGKRLLLLLDNIQLYFNQFPDADIGRMRDILMSKPVFLIVGAAPSYFKQMTGYDEPFYNFFEPIHLNELTPEEAEEMLRLRAEFENAQEFLEQFDQCRPKIRTAVHLTGGNPRLILMLYQVMCESGVAEAAEAFKRLLDELTPYFQGRMDGLAPQGRKVLDTLALMESPATPTELAEAAGISLNAVTSQLKRLKDSGFIQQVKLRRSRETKYEVTERLFRMWREMRTETGRTRLGFIIRFLNLWYTPTQLLDETGKLLTQLGKAQILEKPKLLSHLQYLKEATPELLRPELERVYSYAEAGRIELAKAEIEPLKKVASYEEDLKANLDDATAWFNRGLALGDLSRYDEALESFDRAIQLQPDDARAWNNRGWPLDELGRYEEALESFDKAVQFKSDLAEAWKNRGLELGKLGRHEEALESYDKAIQLQPDDASAWYNRGLALLSLDRHEEALESYDKAIQLQPDDAMTWNNRGVALGSLGRYEEALESYDKAIQLQPDDAMTWNNRGVALGSLGRYEEAFESFDEAVQIRPDDALVWFNRGVALRNFERYEEALESFDKAVQIRPDDALVWFNRGLVLWNSGRYEEASESLDKVVQLQPDNVDAWYNRGASLESLGRHEEALESFDKAVQLQPDDALAWFNRGVALGNLGRYEEELESYDKAIQLQPDDADAWYNRGVALGNLGRYEEALESYNKAVQLQPDNVDAWYNRGLVLGRLGKHDEALESLRKAVELANAQNWEDISEFAVLLAAEIELSTSLRDLAEDNLGSARRALENTINTGKQADTEDFQLLLFGYLKGALKSGKTQFVQEAIEIIVSGLGEEYDELFRPFSIALEYIQTEDVSILERLQQEVRELVLEIAGQARK